MKLAHLLMVSFLVLITITALVFAQEQAPLPVALDGKVVNTLGAPVPEADIVVYGARQDNFVGWINTLLAQAKSDSEGQFHIEAPNLPDYDRVLVVSRHDGLALGSWNGAMAELRYPVMLRMDEPQQISGVVVDVSGQPVAGATIKAMLQWHTDGRPHVVVGDKLIPELMVNSDQQGGFVINAVPRGALASLAVTGRGFAGIVWPNRTPSIPAGSQDTCIELTREATINGVVQCHEPGQSVAGLQVSALFATSFLNPCRTTTDADGHFTVTGLPAGSVQLVVMSEAQDQELPRVGQAEGLTLQAGQAMDNVTIELQRAALMVVSVTSWKDQHPLADAKINVRAANNSYGFACHTDPNGTARIFVLPGNYLLGAEHPMCSPTNSQQLCQATPGQTQEVSLILTDAMMLQGEVVNAEGQPVPDVEVQVVPQNGERSVRTDPQGRFSMRWQPAEWVEAGTSMLVARHEASNSAAAVVIEDPALPVNVKLESACAFTGRVLNDQDQPLHGANIMLMIYGSRWGAPLSDQRSIQTDADGRFQLAVLPLGIEYHITASANGYGQNNWQQEALDGGTIDLGEVKLPRADQKITGLVVDSAGEPLANVQVQIHGEQQPYRDATSDKDGRFTITGVCPGGANLYAHIQNPYRYGQTYVNVGGGDEVKLIVSSSDLSQRPAAKPQPKPLTGRQLPDMTTLGLEAAPQGKPVLLLFFDARQRPSRHAVKQIQAQAAASTSAYFALVQVGPVEDSLLEGLHITLPLARATEAVDETCLQWGLPALPWYILADPTGKVILSDSTLTAGAKK
ncbi:MAG: carboxypeptidase regulatory-like domain-containing protein [Phycisphaeraceae bacterium]|nr:carboxypeptidase regulatory-like domain-containing protein [Phycisphaeraceae bacterium]